MRGRYLLISIGLAILALVLGIRLFEIWLSAPSVPVQEEMAQKPAERPVPEGLIPPPSDYQSIIEKDIFRPSRTKPVPVIAEVKPLPRFNLYGVILVGEKKRAILGSDEPLKKPQSFKIGDAVMEGFEVADILKDRVVLKRGEERIEVALKTSFINLPSPWKKISSKTNSSGRTPSDASQQKLPSSFFQIGDKPPIPGSPPDKPSVRIVPAPINTKPEKP